MDFDYLQVSKAALERLVRACQGLPVAEIELVLARSRAITASLEKMASLVLEHQISQLKNQGLEFIASPEVPAAGGLDRLDSYINYLNVCYR